MAQILAVKGLAAAPPYMGWSTGVGISMNPRLHMASLSACINRALAATRHLS
jgi:hypothetical protein